MILLDTNILSELMRADASQQVIEWLDQQAASALYISVITRAEIELGICLLPNGKKKDRLKVAAQDMFDEFSGRCLSFDEPSAVVYAQLVANRRALGRPVSVEDAQIASIALTHRLTLATRNISDFRFIDELAVINPWDR
jgi:predicted nucleic acid-binding protein